MRTRGNARPLHAGAAAVALALLVAIGGGCSREAPEVKEVRLAAQRYMNAVARKDVEEMRARSTCAVSYQWVRGGNVLRIEEGRQLTMRSLDSLRDAAAVRHRSADSAFVVADASRTEAAHQEALAVARLHTLYHNAIRALQKSNPDTLLVSDTRIETRAVRMRVRYSGAPVGKKPADTEQVLRLVRAPSGKWIAFSFFTADEDPRPDGV
ncbi:MAG TPA: hypothetical protein VFP58_01680 [Candidatus Eisenbacteria bacterium]|nr:hypothetical protein [Candidatus Eisenbacteria bacterium]